MEIFHGACHGCVQQDKHGVAFCVGCQNFDADWSKPELYKKKGDKLDSIKWRARIVSKILHFIFGI